MQEGSADDKIAGRRRRRRRPGSDREQHTADDTKKKGLRAPPPPPRQRMGQGRLVVRVCPPHMPDIAGSQPRSRIETLTGDCF